jgi:hypothetical protein
LFASRDWKGKTIREAFPGLADRGFFERLDAVYATGKPFEARGSLSSSMVTPSIRLDLP